MPPAKGSWSGAPQGVLHTHQTPLRLSTATYRSGALTELGGPGGHVGYLSQLFFGGETSQLLCLVCYLLSWKTCSQKL